jgi:glycosyltransferase involved in cell wall biosynthesis
MDEARRLHADADERAAKQKIELEQALAELSKNRQRVAEQDDQLADLEQRRLEAEANHATLMAEAEQLRADAEDHAAKLKDELERAVRELSAQRQRAAEQDERLADLEQRRLDAEASQTAAVQEAVNLQSELDKEQARLADLNSTLAAQSAQLAQQVSGLNSERESLVAETNRLTEVLSRTRGRVVELDARLQESSAQLARLDSAIHDSDENLRAVLSSTSWKLSSPWRAYRRLVSRIGLLLRGQMINPLFDRDWYLQQYPDAATGERDPYDHYLRYGAAEGRNPNPLFDTKWYLEQYPDVKVSGINPLLHYLLHGGKEARNPSPWFDALSYVARYDDVRTAGINPLLHFFRHGKAEGREYEPVNCQLRAVKKELLAGNGEAHEVIADLRALASEVSSPNTTSENVMPNTMASEFRRFTKPGPKFEEMDSRLAAFRPRRSKIIAFYLPQFHSIPENDLWWGKGFTEWRNVGRALPRFVGHHQPRIPGELGYYDLTTAGIMRRQIDMALAAGLSGFCFYYYSFDGRRILERPLDDFLTNAELNFPFCLMWANENWTRRWDGLDQEVLLHHDYSLDGEQALIRDLARYFSDPRYIRVNGRPLFIIYRPGLIPDAAEAIGRWRNSWRNHFQCDPLILMVQGFGDEDPRIYGLDGAIEFPPHKLAVDLPSINEKLEILDPNFDGKIISYEAVVERSQAVGPPDFPLIRTVFPGWDNEARRQGSGTTYHGSTPKIYEEWLESMVEFSQQQPFYGESFVFVNAWNEWAEAAYLEPDIYWGAAYLNATARAVVPRNAPPGLKILLVGHDACRNGAQLLLLHLAACYKRKFGIETTILLLNDGPLVDKYRQVADVYIVDKERCGAANILSELRLRGYEHAITNTTVSGSVVGLLKELGWRVISLVHELPRIISEFDLCSEAKAIANLSDVMVFASAHVETGFRQVTGEAREVKTVIRPQGLYTRWEEDLAVTEGFRRSLGVSDETKIVLGVGYADFRKGFDIFLAVANFVTRKRPDVHFVWVGETNRDVGHWLLPDVSTGSQARIHVTGFIENLVPIYQASSLFFLSSREDPFPTVILDAFRAGLPVIALANSGGFADIVEGYGKLVERNDIVGIAAAIEEFLDQEKRHAELAAAARREFIDREFRFDDYAYEVLTLNQPDLVKVSVIVPNYNYARYLPGRLDSIFSQTYPIYETVVLDDHSSDDSGSVIERYRREGKREFAVVVNESNSGNAYDQWDRGVKLARGDFVWIAEADDLADSEFVQEMVSSLKNNGAAFAFCDSKQIDENSMKLAGSYSYYFDTVEHGALSSDFVMEGAEFVKRFLSVKNLILNVSGVLWRRSALERALAATRDMRTDMRLASDWMMYVVAALECGPVAFRACALNTHRRHSLSVTHSRQGEEQLREIMSVQRMVAELVELPDEIVTKTELYLRELREQFGLSEEKAEV